jgi:hypothetical protein
MGSGGRTRSLLATAVSYPLPSPVKTSIMAGSEELGRANISVSPDSTETLSMTLALPSPAGVLLSGVS